MFFSFLKEKSGAHKIKKAENIFLRDGERSERGGAVELALEFRQFLCKRNPPEPSAAIPKSKRIQTGANKKAWRWAKRGR